MCKSLVTVNRKNKTLEASKAFLKKASVFGSSEYYMLRDATNENPTYEVMPRPSKKKSYNGLTFERMEDYIKQQPDSEHLLQAFHRGAEDRERACLYCSPCHSAVYGKLCLA